MTTAPARPPPNAVARDARVATPQPRHLGARRRPATLLFALPMLFVFGVFSWSPIVQSVVMSFQKTNLISAAVGRARQLRARAAATRCWARAVRNTLYFALLALVFGFPLPLLLAVLMSEVRRGKGLYCALAYLPVVIPPVVAVLLWKFFYDAQPDRRVQHDPRLGRHPAAAVAPERGAGDAVARARGDVGGGRRDRSSSTSPRCSACRPSSTTRPRSTALASGARSGTSRCRSCAACSSSC